MVLAPRDRAEEEATRAVVKQNMIGERTEAEHDILATPAGKVVGAEISGGRIDLRAAEFKQADCLERKLVRQRD